MHEQESFKDFVKKHLKEDLLKAQQYRGLKLEKVLIHIKNQEELHDLNDEEFIKMCIEIINELKGGKL